MKLFPLLFCASVFICSAVAAPVEPIVVSREGSGFVMRDTGRVFHPWGVNYGNPKGLMEDFWQSDWPVLAADFAKIKAMGANVVRVHLQAGKFMKDADRPDPAALAQLARLLALAEDTGLYLDVTGLGSYRPADVPAWYDSLDDDARWKTQARFWEAVASVCAGHAIVFCYDLMNEPISPAAKREPGKWRSGTLFGGFDFVQYVALDPGARSRDAIAVEWIQRMTAAIRKHDSTTLVTVGLLPWSRDWKHLSGFIPEKVASALDFVSVHLYPETKKPGEALESLRHFAAGKPVVIEETFPLSCTIAELETFLHASREIACGWIGHYDGDSLEELVKLQRAGSESLRQHFYHEWLEMFVRLRPEFGG